MCSRRAPGERAPRSPGRGASCWRRRSSRCGWDRIPCRARRRRDRPGLGYADGGAPLDCNAWSRPTSAKASVSRGASRQPSRRTTTATSWTESASRGSCSGSVINVWKRVDSYARDGFTAIIHGKHYHEETKATSSQVTKYAGGHYLVVRDMSEAREVCTYIEGRGSREQFLPRFAHEMSPGFDPDRDLVRVGVANQTTMLSGESLAIAAEVGKSMAQRYGTAALAEHFRTFDTICSATQDRQDAVLKLIAEPLDLMVVIGGYNSSNTTHLAAICQQKVPTYP